MATTKIDPGICGEYTTVTATLLNDYQVKLEFDTTCPHIKNLADELLEVNAWNEISFHHGTPESIQKGIEHCPHAACPVPVGVVKAIEVAAGLALPKDVIIKVEA